jgi:hypothetical protein
MGLSIRGYGIHGTNVPNSIGKAASHGCIRMAKPDLEELYAQVAVGDGVELIGERNEETARLFGGAAPAVVAQQPAQLAKTNPAPAPAAHSATDAAGAATVLTTAGSALAAGVAAAGAL